MPTFNGQLLDIYEEYATEHRVDEIDLTAVSEWAVKTGRYQRPAITMEKQCKKELANALRLARHTDPQGRTVRSKHVLKLKIKGEQQAFYFWVDIRTAKPNHMRESLQQRRKGILSDVKRHKTDLESYNDNNLYGVQLPLFDYNFNIDLEEEQQSTEYDDTYEDNEHDDNNGEEE